MARKASSRYVQDARCRIVRVDGVTEDEDGYEVSNFVTVYEGPCYTRYPGLAHETSFDSIGVDVTQSRLIVFVPHGPVFAVGDVVTIVDDPNTPHLEGTVLPVASIDDQSHASAQRLLCQDNQKGVRFDG